MSSFENLLEELAQYSTDTRSKGDKFERLMVEYFKTDPLYKERFSNIWLWMDFPERNHKPDTGIDIVAQEKGTDEYCAIQCKFYGQQYTIQKSDIDSFFTESGKKLYSSRIIVTTTDRWSKNAEDAMNEQDKPAARIRLSDLKQSPIDWDKYSLNKVDEMVLREKKALRPHQKEALDAAMNCFKSNDRGKLIMACGTGKTFTSLRISEEFTENKGSHTNILYLVPSISLLSQTVRGWNNDSTIPFDTIAVCSDKKVTKNTNNGDFEDISIKDLGFPATTNANKLMEYKTKIEDNGTNQMTVVFSTYQSIQVIADAQKRGFDDFDLIICDEAHRTAGLTLANEEAGMFSKVHDNTFVSGRKRLYQTATPKIYAPETKAKAEENSAILASMDNEDIFGPEFYYLGFGEAVSKGLLTDYRVMILAVDENSVTRTFQRELADANSELTISDAVKIVGCWNGLAKKKTNSIETYGMPMKRALAFSSSIKISKQITNMFSEISDVYAVENGDINSLRCKVKHVDGTMNALERNERIDWLEEDFGDNECRILSNARCLTEGVDIPDLDAVLFLNPRKSQVDIVQAVGRVMRYSPGKDYGYIILPIGIPSDTTPEIALNNNEKYKAIWQVLQALRSHDERFNAMINQIELNKKKPGQVGIIGVGGGGTSGNEPGGTPGSEQITLNLDLAGVKDAIYGKIVQKVGDRRYWEQWSNDVADIAKIHYNRIQVLIEDKNSEEHVAFQSFLKDLQYDLNPSIDESQAIEMLSQHLITKPVFEALFENYSFVTNNPVSKSMESILTLLEGQSLEKETKSLDKFYNSVRERAAGIDNAQGKQKIIIELYDKFFNTAFSRTTARLGIVFTPIEIVDFIIKSVDDVLKLEFNTSLTDKGVNVLDPFTGTGTFIARLLQSGLIKPEDLLRKYTQELHANEIVLLSYYIAAINIEEILHDLLKKEEYVPFEGIVLTDTFESTEKKDSIESDLFKENNARIQRQTENKVFVVISNPPYSSGQKNSNDNNANNSYPKLEESIDKTYGKHSSANLKKGIYDSYVKSFRWASNRIGEKGIIGFVTNNSFIDRQTFDGLRKCLVDEFSSLYIFNLRGDANSSGEIRKKEGGNVFGVGTKTGIAITLLIKAPGNTENKVFYYDIGDYKKQEEKLSIIHDFGSVKSIPWKEITPDKNNDWINQRTKHYETHIPMYEKGISDNSIFNSKAIGVSTNRDAWVYGFSKEEVCKDSNRMIDNYNAEVERLKEIADSKEKINTINLSGNYIKWSEGLKNNLCRNNFIETNSTNMIQSMYRPYCKKWLNYNSDIIERPGLYRKIFNERITGNKVIYITGVGAKRGFSPFIVDCIPNLDLMEKGQGFPLYFDNNERDLLFNIPSNINEKYLISAQKKYGKNISREDVFYYVYGLLHSKSYIDKYAADLVKDIPRIPFVEHFEEYIAAGKQLANLHLNYEKVDIYPMSIDRKENYNYSVTKMRFGRNKDRTTIIYNNYITINNIPLEAYNYQINGKSAIEWIMEQYRVKVEPNSSIKDDPNLYSDDETYIINLLGRIITISVETNKIVDGLPPIIEI